ncbi:MAG: nicotinate phosphoribosyltransferase [Bacilli bacterium]|nr:nicotinate phosphoribosyltransferase [Bacilli bacterium]
MNVKFNFYFSDEIEHGFYSAKYFLKTCKIIKNEMPGHIVKMQFFQRKNNVMLCGISEVIALIKKIVGNKVIIFSLSDGDIIKANEPVLKIIGKYEDFGFLESVIDGILSRRTRIATNVYKIKKLFKNKNISLFSMADRQDDYLTQIGDGYASYIAGIDKVSTDAQGFLWNKNGSGTMPHALIQMCRGDIIKAVELYIKTFPKEKVVALVDYNNNVIEDSLLVAKKFSHKLYAVRVDTSKTLIDKYFENKNIDGFDPHGVCKELIIALRKELDKHGFKDIKIIVSSGFDYKKIKKWVELKIPVDIYGVGSALISDNRIDFTGDLVSIDGIKEAKAGRYEVESKRLKKIEFDL